MATARAGNVIGGGDWAADRLIPDFLRAIDQNAQLVIRSPRSTRPWQHVLEPLSGYLMLAEQLFNEGAGFSEGWNFGPREEDAKPVVWLLEQLATLFPGMNWRTEESSLHEAHYLSLDSSKAHHRLGWRPRWNLPIALAQTAAWHKAWRNGEDMAAFTQEQIGSYRQSALGDGCGAA